MKSEPEPRYNTRGRKIVVKPHDEKIFAKDWQKQILLKHFKQNPYPDKKELSEIEKKVELDVKWLKNWYCAQRKNPSFRAEALKKGVEIKKEIDNDSLTDGDNTNNESIENEENHDVKDSNDDTTNQFELLQRQFDELQNKYNLMVKLLEEKSILRADEMNNVNEVDENNTENLQETVYHDAEENVTLTEASADATVVQTDSLATDPNQTVVKEETQIPGYPPHPQFAPFPYPFPPYYAPPQGYIPYPPQFYPQPGQPQQQQPQPQFPPMYPPPVQPSQGQQQQPQYPSMQPQGQPPQYPSSQQPQAPNSSGQFQPQPHYPYHPMHQQPPFQPSQQQQPPFQPPPQPQQQQQQQPQK